MEHASIYCTRIALRIKSRMVVCLDGDSAALMHMGAFTMAGKTDVQNLMHVVLNNGAHESVEGTTISRFVNRFHKDCKWIRISRRWRVPLQRSKDLIKAIKTLDSAQKSSFIDVRIHKGLKGALPPLNISHSSLIGEI